MKIAVNIQNSLYFSYVLHRDLKTHGNSRISQLAVQNLAQTSLANYLSAFEVEFKTRMSSDALKIEDF